MKGTGTSPSMWKSVKDESFVSIVGKLLFLILVSGLLLLLILERTGGGIEWIFDRIPILKVVDLSPIGLYVLWLASLWIGFIIGKQVGLKKGAVKERQRLGIPL
jgi:hypothetical protein